MWVRSTGLPSSSIRPSRKRQPERPKKTWRPAVVTSGRSRPKSRPLRSFTAPRNTTSSILKSAGKLTADSSQRQCFKYPLRHLPARHGGPAVGRPELPGVGFVVFVVLSGDKEGGEDAGTHSVLRQQRFSRSQQDSPISPNPIENNEESVEGLGGFACPECRSKGTGDLRPSVLPAPALLPKEVNDLKARHT